MDFSSKINMIINSFPEGKKIYFNNELVIVDFVDDFGQIFCKREDNTYCVIQYNQISCIKNVR